MKRCIYGIVLVLPSCALLDKELETTAPDGTLVSTSIGEVLADNAEPIAQALSSVAGGLTGNPMIAGGVAALVAAALGYLGRRRKNK
jgi:LPXTG-motif cell wall-anchored protein